MPIYRGEARDEDKQRCYRIRKPLPLLGLEAQREGMASWSLGRVGVLDEGHPSVLLDLSLSDSDSVKSRT